MIELCCSLNIDEVSCMLEIYITSYNFFCRELLKKKKLFLTLSKDTFAIKKISNNKECDK